MKTPKFKVGDVVTFKDDFSHNPANKVTAIGRIQLIYLYDGESTRSKYTKDGKIVSISLKGKISYSIASYSLIMPEEKLKLYKKEAKRNESL